MINNGKLIIYCILFYYFKQGQKVQGKEKIKYWIPHTKSTYQANQ